MIELATSAELNARMGGTIGTAQASQALIDASGWIRAISGQTVSFIPDETIVLVGGDRELVLPQRPVVVDVTHALTVIELADFGGTSVPAIEGRDFERVGNELTRSAPYWNASRLMGWPYPRPTGVWAPRVQVTYSHGYQVIPADIVALVLDVAQAVVSNPAGHRSTTIGSYSETYASETLGGNLVESIRSKLAATRRGRRGAFSVRQS